MAILLIDSRTTKNLKRKNFHSGLCGGWPVFNKKDGKLRNNPTVQRIFVGLSFAAPHKTADLCVMLGIYYSMFPFNI